MKAWPAAVAGAGTVALGGLGARYFGSSFRWYFVAVLVALWVLLSWLIRHQEKALARDLKGLGKNDQEDILARLPPKDQERVRGDIEA